MIDEQSSTLTGMFEALGLLRPFDLEGEKKRRFGRSGDGGYVLIERLIGDTFYSFGVAEEVSFEVTMAETGRRGYLFDHTVEGMPVSHGHLTFTKLGLGPSGDARPELRTLESLLRQNGDDIRDDLLLKVDIEGAEYAVLQDVPQTTLNRFSQIALELHDLRRLAEPEFRRLFTAAMTRLNAGFVLCHVHANNCAPLIFTHGLPVADVVELTFVRRDLVRSIPSTTVYPTVYDCANDPDRADIPLLFYPYLSSVMS